MQLASAGVALRIRKQGSRNLLAIKANEDIGPNGLIRRMEWDQPWSRSSYTGSLDILVRLGLTTDHVHSQYKQNPVECMKQSGYLIIQDRETVRLARKLLCDNANQGMELDLDHTRYRTSSGMVNHYEIEIEVSDRDVGLADKLASGLLDEYHGLLPWKHNKLITGLALLNFPVAGMMTRDKNQYRLDKAAYIKLHEQLEN